MAAPQSTFDQFAIDKLIATPGPIREMPFTTGSVNFEVPQVGYGNIDFPYSYTGRRQADNPIGDAVNKLFRGGPTQQFMASPITFNEDEINAARYMSSPDYYKLGISLSGDNEERYGQNQSWSEVLSNGVVGMGRLAYNGFVDGWKQWGRTYDAISNLDWSKLHGDAESMLELDNNLKEIMNSNPIYATKEGTETFWNRQTFGNFLQQSGFTVGALGQMLSEQIITKAIESVLVASVAGAPAAGALETAADVKAAATVGRIGRFFQKGKEFYDAAKNFKALKKLGDVWKNEAALQNFFTSIGQKIPGVDIAMDMTRAAQTGAKAGLSGTKLATDVAKVGLGGLKRTMSEANFAFSEARMEAAGTFGDLYNQMQDDFFKKNGTFAKDEDLQTMQNVAMQAADKNFNFNSAVLGVSNRIMFDNIFKNSKATSKILSKFGEDVGEKGFKVLGKINGRNTTQYYTGGILSNYKQIAADFGTKKARQVLAGSIMKPALKFEVTEGIQELLQEGSNEYYKDYYLNSYKAKFDPTIEVSSKKSFDKAVKSQMNMQGLKTFASGALTGMMIHGPTLLVSKGLSKISETIEDKYKTQGFTEEEKEKYYQQKKKRKEELKNYYNEFNAIAKDPSKFFSESVKNFNVQKEGASALDEAAKLGDKFAYENIRTDMLHGMVSQAVRNNTHEALVDTLREYGKNMSKEEFEQAFVGIDYSSENKKSAQDYTEKVANSVESYAKTYNKLQDKYGSRVNPNRYQFGSKEYQKELHKKQVLNNMIDILAGNEFKATDAINRSTELFSNASKHKTLGSSLASAYNILGSDVNIKNEITLLDNEISIKKEQLKAEGISEETKKQIQSEIESKEKQKQAIQDWLDNKDELINDVKVAKSYEAFKSYLELKNKEYGKESTVNVNEVEDLFVDFNDYIKLNKKFQSHVDAVNMLSNPQYFDQIYERMLAGSELAFYQMLYDSAQEKIKSGLVDENAHFIIEVNGRYGIFSPQGNIVSVVDDLDDARKIKEQLDEAVFGKKPTEETEEEVTTETEEEVSGDIEKEKQKGDYDVIINGVKKQSEVVRSGKKPGGVVDPDIRNMFFKSTEYPNFTDIVRNIIKRRDEELAQEDANEDEIIERYNEILEDLKKGILPEFLETKKQVKKTKEKLFSVDDVITVDGEKITIINVREKDNLVEYDFQLNSDLENKKLTEDELTEKIDTLIYDKKTKQYLNSNGELVEVSTEIEEEEELETETEEEEVSEFEFFNFPDTGAEMLDSSIKPKPKDGGKVIGEGKAGMFVIKRGNTYTITDKYNIGYKKPNTNVSIAFLTEEDAFKKLEEIAKEREENVKDQNKFFEFGGKSIKYAQILKKGKNYFTVVSYGATEKIGNKTGVKLISLNFKDNKYTIRKKVASFETDLSDYNYVYKKTDSEKVENVFKIKDDAFFQKARVSRKEIGEDQWQTDKQAQQELDELLRNTSQKELEENVQIRVYRIPKTQRKEGRIAGGKVMPNKYLLEDGPQAYVAEVYYKNKVVGYIPTDNYFVIKNKAGKTVAIDEMDDATFKSIFDVEGKDAKQMKQNFVASYKTAKSLFYKIGKDLGKNREIIYSGKEALDLFGISTSAGEYDFYTGEKKSQRTPFNSLKYNTIDGAYVILDTATRKGSNDKDYSVIAENADGSFLSTAAYTKLVEQIREEYNKNPDILKSLGRYISVIKLPNGNIKFVELTTRPMSEEKLSSLIEKINAQSKKTKETNLKKEPKQVVVNGKTITRNITEGIDKTFNSNFNDELNSLLFIRVLREVGFTIDLELNPIGNLKINVSKLNRDKKLIRRSTILTSEKDNEPLSFDNVESFIEALNKAILEHDNKLSKDRISEKIDLVLTKESFKESLPDTSKMQDFLAADMLSPVTPDVVKNIKIVFKPNVEIVDDILTEPDIEDVPKKEVGKKATRKKKADLTVEEEVKEEEDKKEIVSETKIIEEKDIESKKQKDISDFNEYNNLLEEKKERIKELQEQFIKAGKKKLVAKNEAEKEASKEYDAKLNALRGKYTGLKVVEQDDFTEASGVDITEFKKWISKNFPDFISVEEMDMLETNMKKKMVTVGMFTAYMKILQDGSKSVAGKIRVGAKTPFKYHEAFHAVFRLMLSEEKIEKYLNLAREEELARLKGDKVKYKELINEFRNIHPIYSSLSEKELEERYLEEKIADRFEEWKTNKQVKTNWSFKTFFAKILELIKTLFRKFNKNELDALFNQIDNGKFKNSRIESNRFTKEDSLTFTEPAYKVIKIGEELVQDENKNSFIIERYLSQSKSDKLSSTIASIYYKRMQSKLSENNNQYNKKHLLDEILDDYKNLYDFENARADYYDELFETYSEIEFEEKYKELKQYYEIFSNLENRKTIKESVDVHLKIMGDKSELESDEYVELIDDQGDRVTTDNWKETHSIGGFGSLSQQLRQYIATTVMEYIDEFGNTNLVDGELLIQSVDANLVYNGVLKAISNVSNQKEIVRRLFVLASDKTETGKFISRFINDIGLIVNDDNTFDISNDANADLFQKVIKGFQQYNVDYIFINKDIRADKKISRIFYANRKDSSKIQFTQWQNAYITIYEKLLRQAKTKEEKKQLANNAALVWDAFNNLVNSSTAIPDDILEQESQEISNNLKNTIGVSISPMLIEFSIISQMDDENRSVYQKKILDSYEGADYITSEQIKEISRTIRSGENPFAKNIEFKDQNFESVDEEEEEIEEEETLGEGGAIKRLNDIAKANAIFDETVYTTSFKNSEGELVYSHQLPTYHLTKVTDLNDEELIETLMSDPYLKNNFLLNSPEFKTLLGNLKVERIDGLKLSLLNETETGDIIENKTLEINQLDGTTYGKFDARQFATALIDLYSFNKKKKTEEGKIFYTSNHLIRVIEASNTADTIALPVVNSVKRNAKKEMVLTNEAQSIIIREIFTELQRIQKVREEINNYKEFGILPESGLIEGYHYKLTEDKETKEVVRDFTKGRGISFYKTANILGEELSQRILDESLNNQEFKIDVDLEKQIKNKVAEYFNTRLQEFLSELVNLNIISQDENGKYENNLLDGFIEDGFIKKVDGENIEDEEKNYGLNIKINDIEHNIWQVFVNDYINTLGFTQLLYGDESQSFKDAVDQVKRAKGANGSGPNAETIITSKEFGIKHEFTKCHITIMDDPKFIKKFGKNAGKKGDQADAQMWMTAKGARYMKFGLGRLTKQQVIALDKIERGEKLTEEEIFGSNGLIKSNGMFNSEKLVYFDGKIYIKTSAVILTKELTSRYDAVTNKWVAKIGREDLHKMREEMEAFEKANDTVSIVVPSSASKGLKRNVIRNVDEFDHNDSDQFTVQETKYWRLQLENPSNKIIITDPTQAKQLITAEQDDDLDVYFSWNNNGTISKTATPIKMKQLKEMYYSDTDQRIKNNYINARNQIFDIENAFAELSASKSLGKITPKLAEFQIRALETLKSLGADSQLIEFFSVKDDKPVYNLNNPLTLDKYTQLFLAYFSKGVMSEKIPGHSIALMSNYGMQVVKRFTGKYTESGEPIGEVIKSEVVDKNPEKYVNAKRMQDKLTRTFDDLKEGDYYVDDLRHNVPEFDKDGNIIGYYTEFMLPPHFKELLRLLPEEAIPDVIQKAFGVRIPTQDKHSFINLKMVDYLPAFMGSTGVFAHELIEISGADFDIDKLYMAIHDFYVKNNKFIPYGSAKTNDAKYNEYLIWNLKNNKELKNYFKQLKNESAAYQNASRRLKSIKDLRNSLKRLIADRPVGSMQLTKEYITAVNTNKLINDLVNSIDDVMFTSTEDDFNFLQVGFESMLNDMEKWEERDFAIGLAESTLKELRSLVRDSVIELNGLKDAESMLLNMALEKYNLPTSTEEFIKMSNGKELNNGVLNNRILDTKIALFGNSKLVTGKNPVAFEPATVDDLQELVEIFTKQFVDQSNPEANVEYMKNILIESGIDVDNMYGKLKAFVNNKEGSKNIGVAVNAMLGYNVLNTFKIELRKSYKKKEGDETVEEYFPLFTFDNQVFDTYANTKSYNTKTKQFDGIRIAGVISTLVSAMTDNAKERLAAKLGLNIEALGYVSNMVSLGVPLDTAIMYMLQPIVLEYFKNIKVNSSNLKTLNEERISKQKLLSGLLDGLSKEVGDDFEKIELNNDLLSTNIRQEGSNPALELSILMDFSIIVNQTEYFNKISQVLKLTKGLGTSWESKDAIDQNIKDLGLKLNDEEFELSKIPIDLRQVFLGVDPKKPYHKFMKSYINISDQIEYLSKTVFIEKTDIFNKLVNLVYDNFYIRRNLLENFSITMKRDIISYLCIRAYMKKLKDGGNFASLNSLDNALIYDALAEKKDPATFADIVKTMSKIRQELPNNYLANNFLNVLRTYKIDADDNIDFNEYNKDGINKVEANTWAKLSEYQQEKLLDSFIEIYQNDNLRESGLATALFHYLLVKDGGQFKSGSYIKFIPNFMFKTLMDSATIANELLQKEYTTSVRDEYKKIFGFTLEELMNDFLNIYTSSVGNELFIKSFVNRKMNEVSIDSKLLPDEQKEVKEALKNHDEKQAIKFTEDGTVYVNIFAGVREYMIPVEKDGRIIMVRNPKAKEKFSSVEKALMNKNIEYIKSKGFKIEQTPVGRQIQFPIEMSNTVEKTKNYYRLSSVDKQKSKKDFYYIDNPLELIDIENNETIAKGIKAVYVKVEKRGSKRQTKIAHMFGKPPIKKQLPTSLNKETLGFVGFNSEYDEREEYAEIIDVNQKAKVVKAKKTDVSTSEIKKKLLSFGITYEIKNKKFVFKGEVWDQLSEEDRKLIKKPSDLLKLLDVDAITLYEDEDEKIMSDKKVVKKTAKREQEKVTVFEQADDLPYIEQNYNTDLNDYSRGRYKVGDQWKSREVLSSVKSKFPGKKVISSMDMIKAGIRKRSTRTENWMNNFMDYFGIENPKNLVGVIIKQVDQHTGEYVYTRITAVNEFNKKYQDQTWELEGWTKSITDRLLYQKNKDGEQRYKWAIEFEVVKPDFGDYRGVEKIISGMQTGVDTQVGLETGVELNLKTGGTAPENFQTQEGRRPELAKQFKVKEVDDRYRYIIEKLEKNWSSIVTDKMSDTNWYSKYYERNVYNILDSDATVIFAKDIKSTGTEATIMMLKYFKKKYIINPTAKQLEEFLEKNEIRTLNVAGNRMSKLGKTETEQLKNVKTFKQTLKNALETVNSKYESDIVEYYEEEEDDDVNQFNDEYEETGEVEEYTEEDDEEVEEEIPVKKEISKKEMSPFEKLIAQQEELSKKAGGINLPWQDVDDVDKFIEENSKCNQKKKK